MIINFLFIINFRLAYYCYIGNCYIKQCVYVTLKYIRYILIYANVMFIHIFDAISIAVVEGEYVLCTDHKVVLYFVILFTPACGCLGGEIHVSAQ